MNLKTISQFHKEQIHHLQNAIWNLERAEENIKYAKGNPNLEKVYLANIECIKDDLQDDINNIFAESDND